MLTVWNVAWYPIMKNDNYVEGKKWEMRFRTMLAAIYPENQIESRLMLIHKRLLIAKKKIYFFFDEMFEKRLMGDRC